MASHDTTSQTGEQEQPAPAAAIQEQTEQTTQTRESEAQQAAWSQWKYWQSRNAVRQELYDEEIGSVQTGMTASQFKTYLDSLSSDEVMKIQTVMLVVFVIGVVIGWVLARCCAKPRVREVHLPEQARPSRDMVTQSQVTYRWDLENRGSSHLRGSSRALGEASGET